MERWTDGRMANRRKHGRNKKNKSKIKMSFGLHFELQGGLARRTFGDERSQSLGERLKGGQWKGLDESQ